MPRAWATRLSAFERPAEVTVRGGIFSPEERRGDSARADRRPAGATSDGVPVRMTVAPENASRGRSRAGKCISSRKFLARSLKRQSRRQQKARRRCRRKCTGDSVHDLRVESRRLLARLDLLGALHSFPALAKARRALKRQLEASSALRDTHVQLRLTRQIAGDGSERKRFRQHLHGCERRQARTLARKLKAAGGRKLMAALRQSLRALPETAAADKHARVLLGQMLAEKFRKMVQLQRRARADAACLHRARIALKKFRYVVEALQPLLGSGSAAELRRLHRCQTLMGEIHDLDLMLLGLEANKSPKAEHTGFHRRRARLLRSYRAAAASCFPKGPAVSLWPRILAHLSPA